MSKFQIFFNMLISALFVSVIIAIFATDGRYFDHEDRITVLEKQLKESQKTADYRLDLCRKQLGKR